MVLTHDLDFGAMLAANQGHKPSVVQLRADDVRPEAIGRQTVATLQQLDADLERGAPVTIDARRTRIRILPLRL